MLLEKDHFFPKQQKAWVSKSHCERLPEGEQKVWKWAQMSFYRTWKQEMLLDMGLLSHDLDQLDELVQVQVLPYPAIPAGGIELQHLHLGWRVMVWHMLQSSFLDGHSRCTCIMRMPKWTWMHSLSASKSR